ncbi:hypothetical protein KM043_002401 [Ampulex compressa]|nr:hypothetical protein KM043_002401 [Ampulex compressa]
MLIASNAEQRRNLIQYRIPMAALSIGRGQAHEHERQAWRTSVGRLHSKFSAAALFLGPIIKPICRETTQQSYRKEHRLELSRGVGAKAARFPGVEEAVEKFAPSRCACLTRLHSVVFWRDRPDNFLGRAAIVTLHAVRYGRGIVKIGRKPTNRESLVVAAPFALETLAHIEILIIAIVPIYAAGDVFGDLLAQEFEYVTVEHTREKRQTHAQAQQLNYRPYSQAPAQIKQLLQAQQAREPIVHLPAQPPPHLGPSRPIEPQHLTQAQVSAYRPHVQVGNAPQQPSYKSIPTNTAQYRPPAAAHQGQQYTPQYRPAANYQPNVQQAQHPGNVPAHIKQLLQAQANLPNNIPQGHRG